MIQIKIDTIELTVPAGTTILKAAERIGITIPVMCHNENVPNHASCMVCSVKNNLTGNFIPACESKVQKGMDLSCNTEEVFEFRKNALELLLSDHTGDCEAPCRVGCPAFMDIPKMNRLIAQGNFTEALANVKEEIALPLILGYICSAPCEGACRRKQVENAVSICQLKKFVALENTDYFPPKEADKNKKIAIIGAGIAGLTAAYHVLRYGYNCVVFDKNPSAGGSLLSVSEDELPQSILEKEIDILQKYGAEFRLNTPVNSRTLKLEYDAVIIATGADSKEADIEINKESYTTNYPNVFACGSVIAPVRMAVKVLAQGKTAAKAAHIFLSGNTVIKQQKTFNSRFGKLTETEILEYIKESKAADRTVPLFGVLPGFAKEEAVIEAERCMHCDCRKSKSCILRLLSDQYQADQRKYKPEERKIIRKYFKTDVLVYEPEKCIKCGLCVETVKRNGELVGLTYIRRGFDMHISVPFNQTLDKAIEKAAIECIQTCPTGALSNYAGEDKQTTK
jgi:ferredoxin